MSDAMPISLALVCLAFLVVFTYGFLDIWEKVRRIEKKICGSDKQ